MSTRKQYEGVEEGGEGLVWGTVVVLDLDRFEETIEERGWSQYTPNPATGLLSHLVEQLARKWSAVIVYGLDWERGTEEAVLEIPLVEPEELREDLERIKEEVNKLGVGITIVAVRGYVGLKPAKSRREAYTATPTRRLAIKLLRRAKRRGGNTIIIA